MVFFQKNKGLTDIQGGVYVESVTDFFYTNFFILSKRNPKKNCNLRLQFVCQYAVIQGQRALCCIIAYIEDTPNHPEAQEELLRYCVTTVKSGETCFIRRYDVQRTFNY